MKHVYHMDDKTELDFGYGISRFILQSESVYGDEVIRDILPRPLVKTTCGMKSERCLNFIQSAQARRDNAQQ